MQYFISGTVNKHMTPVVTNAYANAKGPRSNSESILARQMKGISSGVHLSPIQGNVFLYVALAGWSLRVCIDTVLFSQGLSSPSKHHKESTPELFQPCQEPLLIVALFVSDKEILDQLLALRNLCFPSSPDSVER
jgi:hypothetical protein